MVFLLYPQPHRLLRIQRHLLPVASRPSDCERTVHGDYLDRFRHLERLAAMNQNGVRLKLSVLCRRHLSRREHLRIVQRLIVGWQLFTATPAPSSSHWHQCCGYPFTCITSPPSVFSGPPHGLLSARRTWKAPTFVLARVSGRCTGKSDSDQAE